MTLSINQRHLNQSKRELKLKEKEQSLLKELEKNRRELKNLSAKINASNRKLDAKKKILIGAMVLNAIEQGRFLTIGSNDDLLAKMDLFLSRQNERALFSLSPRENKENLGAELEKTQEAGFTIPPLTQDI